MTNYFELQQQAAVSFNVEQKIYTINFSEKKHFSVKRADLVLFHKQIGKTGVEEILEIRYQVGRFR